MKLKEYPEIVFDSFPKLYERSTKVFITHLYDIDEMLHTIPKHFCKIYTTPPLAAQLIHYLNFRKVKIPQSDFSVSAPFEPFKLRLSDGTHLEVMFADGSTLGNTLVVLIRKEGCTTEPLLYFYNSIQQTRPRHLLCNKIFNEWISKGTNVLYLNLQGATKPFHPIDFDELANNLEKSQSAKQKILIHLPTTFGYEFFIQEMVKRLRKRIILMEQLLDWYKLLNVPLLHFAANEEEARILIYNKCSIIKKNMQPLDLKLLGWSPVPTRENLHLFCSLLRPKKIDWIPINKEAVVYKVPEFLYKYTINYQRKQQLLQQAAVPLPITWKPSPRSKHLAESAQQLTDEEDAANASQLFRQQLPQINRKRKLAYIDDSTVDNSE